MRSTRRLAWVLALLLAACGGDKAPYAKKLKPVVARSFATPMERMLIGVLGDGWALRIRLDPDAFPYDDADLPLDRRVWAPEVMLIRGPKLATFVRPPSGVPTLPIPSGTGYRLHVVEDLWVRVVATERLPEPRAYVEVSVEPFHADGVRYALPGTLRLPIKGPYP